MKDSPGQIRSTPTRDAIRDRVVEAVSDFYPHADVVRVKAFVQDDCWNAAERTQGRGTHDAFLVLVRQPSPPKTK